MKKFLLIPALLVLTFLSNVNFAQEDEAMMKAWQEYATPGPMHEVLAKGVGSWKAEITTWMDPSMPPSKSEGTSEGEMIMGGRYFQGKFTGDYMGQPMHGMEITGYDNAKKEFLSIWIDNMGTGIMHLTGKYDEASKTMTYTGSAPDPMGGTYQVREVLKYVDDSAMHFEMYYTAEGKPEMKSMEIKYTKVK